MYNPALKGPYVPINGPAEIISLAVLQAVLFILTTNSICYIHNNARRMPEFQAYPKKTEHSYYLGGSYLLLIANQFTRMRFQLADGLEGNLRYCKIWNFINCIAMCSWMISWITANIRLVRRYDAQVKELKIVREGSKLKSKRFGHQPILVLLAITCTAGSMTPAFVDKTRACPGLLNVLPLYTAGVIFMFGSAYLLHKSWKVRDAYRIRDDCRTTGLGVWLCFILAILQVAGRLNTRSNDLLDFLLLLIGFFGVAFGLYFPVHRFWSSLRKVNLPRYTIAEMEKWLLNPVAYQEICQCAQSCLSMDLIFFLGDVTELRRLHSSNLVSVKSSSILAKADTDEISSTVSHSVATQDHQHTSKYNQLLQKVFCYFPTGETTAAWFETCDDVGYELNLNQDVTEKVIKCRRAFERHGMMPEKGLFDDAERAVKQLLFENTYRAWCLAKSHLTDL